MPKTIFVASSSVDESTWGPVVTRLRERGCHVIVYEADKVARGDVPLSIRLSPSEDIHITYGEAHFRPKDIHAAWLRRPSIFSKLQKDVIRQTKLDSERAAMQRAIWDSIPQEVWLNQPRRMDAASPKMIQLAVAREVGFMIPTTLITNDWKTILDTLPEKIALKSAYGRFDRAEGAHILHTQCLENSPKALPLKTNPFPGYWQNYIPKFREWRITVVGERSFDAAIYTNGRAQVDWRRYQRTADVQFKKGTFPEGERQKCFAYLRHFGLRFGAFDFIEDLEGRITFLECNENGQYGWLERLPSFSISDEIADELWRIANRKALKHER